MQREQLQALFLDLDVHAVNFVVALNNLARTLVVGLVQRIDRRVDHVFDAGAHRHDRLVQMIEIANQVDGHPLFLDESIMVMACTSTVADHLIWDECKVISGQCKVQNSRNCRSSPSGARQTSDQRS